MVHDVPDNCPLVTLVGLSIIWLYQVIGCHHWGRMSLWAMALCGGVRMGSTKAPPILGSSDLRFVVLCCVILEKHARYIWLPFFWFQRCLLWRSPVWFMIAGRLKYGTLSIVRLTTSRKTDGYQMMTHHWFGHRVLAAEFVDEAAKLVSFCSLSM